MNKQWKKFIECDCKTEGVMVGYQYEDGTNDYIELAFFQHYPGTAPMNWKDRLRWSWNIIKTGQPYSDMVILNRKTARDLMMELKLFLASLETHENEKTSGSQTAEGTEETTQSKEVLQQEFDFVSEIRNAP